MRIGSRAGTDGGIVTISDAATSVTKNSNMTTGLTINQGAADDQILAFKSSDVAHGLTSAGFAAALETDTFGLMHKRSATLGGLTIHAVAEDAVQTGVLTFYTEGGQASTGKSTGVVGLVDFLVQEHDGSNARANITADGAVFTVRARVGGANATRWILDEDGDTWQTGYTEHEDGYGLRWGGDTYFYGSSSGGAEYLRADMPGKSAAFFVGTAGMVGIGDTANGNMTTGLTINQGAADNQILAFKSSDVNTGLTTVTYPDVEVDDYVVFAKESATLGGLAMTVLQESGNVVNLGVRVYGGTAQTTHTTAGRSLVEFAVYEHDDANALADITSQGNVFGIRAYVGGASATRFLVDEDGDLFAAQDGTTGVTVIDEYEDAHLVRAYDLSKRVKTGLVRSEWDKFIKYNEQDLIDVGVMGDTVENGGLLNVTGLQRLHNGAIWQGYVRQQEMQEKIDTLENRLLAIEGA